MKTAWLSLSLLSTVVLAQPDKETDTSVVHPLPFGVQTMWRFYPAAKYEKIEAYTIHVLGTPSVSDWMMRESCCVISNMVAALKRAEDRGKFSGHQAFLITDADPALPGTRGHRNTGGHGFSLFNEVLVCAEAVDTLYPDCKPQFRAWDTPVHEFGHAIEETLGLQSNSDTVFSKHVEDYNPKIAREYFAWAVQSWFSSSSGGPDRNALPTWELEYLSSVFSAENKWKPVCSSNRPSRAAATTVGTATSNAAAVTTEAILSMARRVDVRTLVGTYQRNPVENDWHVGSIAIEARSGEGRPTVLRWTNRAGTSWRLFPDLDAGGLRTDKENPYYSQDEDDKMFLLAFDMAKATSAPTCAAGFWFQGRLYTRTSGAK